MKEIERLASLERRLARIEKVLGISDSPVLENPQEKTGPVPARITDLRKELRAAGARAKKKPGSGRGSISPESRLQAVKEVVKLSSELEELERDWLKESVKPKRRRKGKS